MAALRLDQAGTGAVSAIVGTGEAQVPPRPTHLTAAALRR